MDGRHRRPFGGLRDYLQVRLNAVDLVVLPKKFVPLGCQFLNLVIEMHREKVPVRMSHFDPLSWRNEWSLLL
jgi:hypothetical protein